MTLAELIEILEEKDYWLKPLIPNSIRYTKKTIAEVNEIYGSVEKYLNKIAKANNIQTLKVALYCKNGSSPKVKYRYMIELPYNNNASTSINEKQQIETESNKKQQVETNINKKQYESTKENTHQHQSIQISEHKQKMYEKMISKSDIEVVHYKTENKYLAEKVEELKNRNKELERKNDVYYNENLRLTREHATEKDKCELAYKHKELDLVSKQKQGLSGVLEDVKTLPPEAWQFIAGLLPNHPMAKGMLPVVETNQTVLNGTAKHNDSDAQTCMEVMDALLLKQSPEIVGMAAMLCEHLVTHPTILKAVYDKFFPQQNVDEKK